MNNIMRPFLDQFVIGYLDDILIFSETLKDHVKRLEMVLQKLRGNGSYAKPE